MEIFNLEIKLNYIF